jgi:hypothetical protein
MKEPFTLRISDSKRKDRASRFEEVLDKRAANPTEVMRRLIDAYIEAGGDIIFPIRFSSLLDAEAKKGVKQICDLLGIECDIDNPEIRKRVRMEIIRRLKKRGRD